MSKRRNYYKKYERLHKKRRRSLSPVFRRSRPSSPAYERLPPPSFVFDRPHDSEHKRPVHVDETNNDLKLTKEAYELLRHILDKIDVKNVLPSSDSKQPVLTQEVKQPEINDVFDVHETYKNSFDAYEHHRKNNLLYVPIHKRYIKCSFSDLRDEDKFIEYFQSNQKRRVKIPSFSEYEYIIKRIALYDKLVEIFNFPYKSLILIPASRQEFEKYRLDKTNTYLRFNTFNNHETYQNEPYVYILCHMDVHSGIWNVLTAHTYIRYCGYVYDQIQKNPQNSFLCSIAKKRHTIQSMFPKNVIRKTLCENYDSHYKTLSTMQPQLFTNNL